MDGSFKLFIIVIAFRDIKTFQTVTDYLSKSRVEFNKYQHLEHLAGVNLLALE